MKGPFGNAVDAIPAEWLAPFWERVDKSGACWLWQGTLDSGGYGVFRLVRAHRISWVIANGPLAAGELVLHHCDNRRCVRPMHLFMGTQRDNVLDMVAKGRHTTGGWRSKVRGQDHPAAKLTDEQVAAVRVLRASGWSQRRIGSLLGLSHTYVGMLERGEKRAG